jgi:membrane protein involved in colicin uptake
MAKVISTKWVKSTVLGVYFDQEKQGDNFVGVAEMSDEEAQTFVGRDGFTVEGLEQQAKAKADAEAAKAKADAELKAKQEAEAKAKADAEAAKAKAN